MQSEPLPSPTVPQSTAPQSTVPSPTVGQAAPSPAVPPGAHAGVEQVHPAYPVQPTQAYPPVPAYWTAPPPRQNVIAWVAFGLGLGGLVAGLLASIPAIVLGHIALSQVRRTGEQGRVPALVGLISGYVISAGIVLFLALYLLFVVGLLTFAFTAAAEGSSV